MSSSRTATSTGATATNFATLSLRSESPPRSRNKAPLKYGGSLDKYDVSIHGLSPYCMLTPLQSFEVTPAIGREFKDLQLAELLDAPNSDELIRDLAITGSSA